MKTQIIGALALILLAGNGVAQEVRFGLRGGANFTMMPVVDKNPLTEGYKSRLASGGGIFTEVQLTEAFSVRAGIEYSGQGGVKEGLQAMSTMRKMTEIMTNIGMSLTEEMQQTAGAAMSMMPAQYYANVKSTMRFDYVSIPILAQYTLGLGNSPLEIYINGGPYVSFIVSATQIAEGTSSVYYDAAGQTTIWSMIPNGQPPMNIQSVLKEQLPAVAEFLEKPYVFGKTDITGEMKSANFGVAANIGIRYKYNRSCFFIEGGGNYGFIAVQQEKSNGTNRLGAASVMLGYSFSMF